MSDLNEVTSDRAAAARAPALRVEDLTVRTASGRTLVDGVSLTVGAGERVGLIGESGSGKSLTALAVLGLLADNLAATGRVDVAGEHDLLARSDRRLAPLRGSLVSMVFQEPMTALDPLVRVGRQVAEVVLLHDLARTGRGAKGFAPRGSAPWSCSPRWVCPTRRPPHAPTRTSSAAGSGSAS